MTSTTTAASSNEKPAIIATRQHCEAEGVGLSHYILMDRSASTQATAAETPVAAAPDAAA